MSSMSRMSNCLQTPTMPPDSNWKTRDGLAAIEQIEGLLVIERDRCDVEIGRVLVDQLHGVVDDGERLQPEEIHLQHPEIRQRLPWRTATTMPPSLRARERDVFRKIAIADDDARRVDAGAAREPFELRGVSQSCFVAGSFSTRFFQLGILVDRAGDVLGRARLLILLVLAVERDVEIARPLGIIFAMRSASP